MQGHGLKKKKIKQNATSYLCVCVLKVTPAVDPTEV